MTLLFVLLAAWVVGAIMVLAFLSGAQRLGETDSLQMARTADAFRTADARIREGLREAVAPTTRRFPS